MPAPSSNRAEAASDVMIAIARDPALVRTVRLVAAAVARRADCPDALVEEIRLAVGEACAVMIGAHQQSDGSDQVEVRIRTQAAFAVTVTGRVESDEPGFEEIGLDPWALLRGISEDLTITDSGDRTTLEMSWGR